MLVAIPTGSGGGNTATRPVCRLPPQVSPQSSPLCRTRHHYTPHHIPATHMRRTTLAVTDDQPQQQKQKQSAIKGFREEVTKQKDAAAKSLACFQSHFPRAQLQTPFPPPPPLASAGRVGQAAGKTGVGVMVAFCECRHSPRYAGTYTSLAGLADRTNAQTHTTPPAPSLSNIHTNVYARGVSHQHNTKTHYTSLSAQR